MNLQISESKLKENLETYIHGIDINPESVEKCKNRLTEALKEFNLDIVPEWDIRCANALEITDYDGKMDVVVGNPPYVRVHNVKDDQSLYEVLKSYKFCKEGNTDLYIAFYELGLRMLSPKGRLVYISPSGWLHGVSGAEFRNYVMENRNLVSFTDFGEEKPFKGISVYTGIFEFQSPALGKMDFVIYRLNHEKSVPVDYDKMSINGEFYFGDSRELNLINKINNFDGEKQVTVKNGLATLADDIFISDGIRFNGMLEVPIVKASTGEEKTILFPYTMGGSGLDLNEIKDSDSKAYDYLIENETRLKERNYDDKWWLIGRRQGISDYFDRKLAVNNLVKDKNSVKITYCCNSFVYSGFYVILQRKLKNKVGSPYIPTEEENESVWVMRTAKVYAALKSDEFIKYVKSLKKYKSGGYYTFSAKNLENFLNWKLSQ